VSRWEPNARERLESAALELFVEQGFAETTVPQITARAGLTTRTFFRHFSDKREVLFAGENQVPEIIRAAIAASPPGLDPMELVERGFDDFAAAQFDGRHASLKARQVVVQGDASLIERELQKSASLAEAMRQGFLERGVDDLTATLSAHLCSAVFTVAIQRWLASGEQPFAPLLHDTLRQLRAVAA
jgi:AcrR family transcriptional regulator